MPMGTLTTRRDAVPYDELADFHTVFRGEVHEAVRMCLVPFNRRFDFNYAMLPQVSLGSDLNQVVVSKFGDIQATLTRRTLNRLDPEAHPRYWHLVAVSAEEVKGLGWPTKDAANALDFRGGPATGVSPTPQGFPPTGYCVIAVTYRNAPYLLQPTYTNDRVNDVTNPTLLYEWVRYTNLKAKASAKNMVLPGTQFRYATLTDGAGTNLIVPERGTQTVPTAHLAYTWYMCPAVPATAQTLMGCTNSLPFDYASRGLPLKMTFATGTLLYLNFECTDHYFTTGGTPVVDVTYHFMYLPSRHNWLFSHAAGKFLPVFRPVGNITTFGQIPPGPPDAQYRFPPGYNIYDYADLNTLFCVLR